ncbi:MAG: C10 family peptidase [Candidatus Cloacimonetes bacterium]|nr:C10 family peptidase [Candidatus Cloacimonadota bacterium]
MKLRSSILFVIILVVSSVFAGQVSIDSCERVAFNKLEQLGKDAEFTLCAASEVIEQGRLLFVVFELSPQGYIVTSADDNLPPVIAYSFTSRFYDELSGDIMLDLLKADLSLRLENISALPETMLAQRQAEWQELLAGNTGNYRPDQWPPEGSTPTGGWLLETWSQSAPYNGFCPMDPVTGGRSIAGCPSIAMAQILDYHRTTNSVHFDDDDDYYHNYAGRQYWIDDDYLEQDFLSFPQMNELLDSLAYHYLHDLPVTNEAKAALVFACGVAAQQVYTSQGSGTFGVDQAYDAYQKFNFDNVLLIDDTMPDFYEHLAQNIMDALPVHLATVTPAWDSGHNFVIDGYNTDGYFHLNLGWSGSYNGWYLLPDEIPYGLTVIEGAVVDIVPEELPAGFISGEIILEPAVADTLMICITIQNYNEEYQLYLEPDDNGTANYMEQFPIGCYTVTASYPDYEYIAYDNIIVEEYQITTVDFMLYQLQAPSDLTGMLSGNEVTLNWQHASSRMFQYYNIYRNINSTAYTLLDTTSQSSYLDQITIPQSLCYGYYITAVYSQSNESHASNSVFIEYNSPVSNDEIESSSRLANYPNPFNPSTTICFSLQDNSSIELEVYNIKGQQVKILATGEFEKGEHLMVWDGTDDKQQPVAAGVYFYRLKAEGVSEIKRMVLIK